MPEMLDVKNAVEDLGVTMGEFKQSQETQMLELKARLDDMEKKENRLQAGGDGAALDAFQVEHKAAFETFIRKGNKDGLRDLEQKAMNTISGEDGGFAVPEQLDREIHNLIRDESPMRQIARVVTVKTAIGEYKKLVNKHGTASGWVGETESRPETGAPKLALIGFPEGEVYANPAVTQNFLDDSSFDVGEWLTEEISKEFSEQEGAAFVTGNGIKKPKGFLTAETSADGDTTRPFGTLMYMATGVDGGFKALDAANSVSPSDTLIDVTQSLKAGYRKNGVWLMNAGTLAVVRKWKDADGNNIWVPGLQAGQPSMFVGYPVYECEDMPNVGSGTYPIAFGDFKNGYIIVDRITRIMRDPYTNKPYVHFYATKRVSGGLLDSNAIRLVKCSAS
jgi:HK97 family phage major capsid protein